MNRTSHTISAALAGDRVLDGVLDLDGFAGHTITLPFSEGDLDIGRPSGGLKFASLYGPAVLLDAYEQTGSGRYLRSAAEIIAAFAEYERKQLLPRGYLWNDHAIAARAEVIIRFWRLYRSSPEYDAEVARAAIRHLARCAALLANPEHFTFRTNHGVLQNIALLQTAAAVPSLPGSKSRAALAAERLEQQFQFYVSDDGVILEHSAGYQVLGVELLRAAIQLTAINGLEVPADWRVKARKSEEFLSLLIRPDGTLPAYGDTDAALGPTIAVGPSVPSEGTSVASFPLSGYAVIRDRAGTGPVDAHTIVVWSGFRDHGHKVADEMSLLVWARGNTWITNIGYWPYGIAGREQAEGWLGGNAPHWQGEAPRSERVTQLMSFAETPSLAALDLQRTMPSGGHLRRQIFVLSGTVWLVLDSGRGAQDQTAEVLWTFAPNLSVAKADAYLALDAPGNASMRVEVLGTDELHTARYSGSMDPFAGWVAQAATPTPAPSVLLRRPGARSPWSATVFTLTQQHEVDVPPTRVAFVNESKWSAEGSAAGMSWRLQRDTNHLDYIRGTDHATVPLVAGPDVSAKQAAIEASLQMTAQKYPPYWDLISARERLSVAAMVLWLLQELAFLIFARVSFVAGWVPTLRMMALCAWIVGALWVHGVYLQV
jgi:hypothetical protein